MFDVYVYKHENVIFSIFSKHMHTNIHSHRRHLLQINWNNTCDGWKTDEFHKLDAWMKVKNEGTRVEVCVFFEWFKSENWKSFIVIHWMIRVTNRWAIFLLPSCCDCLFGYSGSHQTIHVYTQLNQQADSHTHSVRPSISFSPFLLKLQQLSSVAMLLSSLSLFCFITGNVSTDNLSFLVWQSWYTYAAVYCDDWIGDWDDRHTVLCLCVEETRSAQTHKTPKRQVNYTLFVFDGFV